MADLKNVSQQYYGTKKTRKGYRVVFIIGFCLGFLLESLLFIYTQVKEIGLILKEDFKIILVKDPAVKASVNGIEDGIRSLGGVSEVFFISRQERLKNLEKDDPEIANSISSIGANPLPDTFEVSLDETAIGQVDRWINSASKIEGISDIKHKPFEAYAILHAMFYSHFIFVSIVVSFVSVAFLILMILIYRFNPHNLAVGIIKDKNWFFAGFAGSLSAALCCYGLVYPIKNLSPIWMWPDPLWHLAVVLSGGCAGWAIFQWKNEH
ncbi:MAG: hypothetical protein HY746_08010 [Elusimicrobia bacterium]|nr:hypothetical protein [Elusimicrobiota bacterium]